MRRQYVDLADEAHFGAGFTIPERDFARSDSIKVEAPVAGAVGVNNVTELGGPQNPEEV